MKIGFHADAFNSAYWSFDKCLAWAHRNGVPYIECGLIDGVSWIHGLGYPPHVALCEDPVLLRRKMDRHGVQFSQVDAAFPLSGEDGPPGVFQVLPKTESHIDNDPRIGYANAESVRMLLGTVPIEPDGSAYFRAPERMPLYFQAVDEDRRAIQTMRSVTYLQPGFSIQLIASESDIANPMTMCRTKNWNGTPGE